MTLTKKQLNSFEKEELAAAKEYAKLGLIKFSKDEQRHANFFKMLKNKKGEK